MKITSVNTGFWSNRPTYAKSVDSYFQLSFLIYHSVLFALAVSFVKKFPNSWKKTKERKKGTGDFCYALSYVYQRQLLQKEIMLLSLDFLSVELELKSLYQTK